MDRRAICYIEGVEMNGLMGIGSRGTVNFCSGGTSALHLGARLCKRLGNGFTNPAGRPRHQDTLLAMFHQNPLLSKIAF
jgi:hypothetical protein